MRRKRLGEHPMDCTTRFETRYCRIDSQVADGDSYGRLQFSLEQEPALSRPSPRDTASIASAIHELRSRCPHIEPPRFPPVVRRVHSALLGAAPSTGSEEAQDKNGARRRRCAEKHTLATRDVVHERGVLALEVTAGRKRVYKKKSNAAQPAPEKDKKAADGCHGSFDMVQVCITNCEEFPSGSAPTGPLECTHHVLLLTESTSAYCPAVHCLR